MLKQSQGNKEIKTPAKKINIFLIFLLKRKKMQTEKPKIALGNLARKAKEADTPEKKILPLINKKYDSKIKKSPVISGYILNPQYKTKKFVAKKTVGIKGFLKCVSEILYTRKMVAAVNKIMMDLANRIDSPVKSQRTAIINSIKGNLLSSV